MFRTPGRPPARPRMKRLNLVSDVVVVDHAQRVGRLLMLCALTGVVAGLGAGAFEVLTGLFSHLFLDLGAGFRPPTAVGDQHLFHPSDTPLRPWGLALLPAFGGLAGGALVYGLAPDADGPGTEAAIDAFHNRRGVIRGRVPIVKTIASAITLGTGGSAGREGPIALIGAGVGSVLAVTLKLSVRERRMLMVAGMAAGIGAVFRAPLAAALFSAEVLYREMDMEFEVLVPSVISSIVSYSIFTLMFGAQPLFTTAEFSFSDPRQLLPYTLLAIVVAGGAYVFTTVFRKFESAFKALKIPRVLKPALGGLGVGMFALVLPETVASGYGYIQQSFLGEVSLGILVTIAVGKMITTSLTVGSGQSGGVFGPSIVIGGAIGGVVAELVRFAFPSIVPPTGAFVMVGMAGFFAGAANTPLASIIMVSEMTGNYRLLVPSMWVCMIAFLLVRRTTLYAGQLSRRSESPVHLGEMMQEVLDRLTVAEALKRAVKEPLVTVHASATLTELCERFATSHHSSFPVVDDEGRMVGVIDDGALRLAVTMHGQGMEDIIVAHDLIERAPKLFATDSLHAAMHAMVTSGRDELVVVDEKDPSRAIGALSRRDLVSAYDLEMRRDLDERGRSSGDRVVWGAPPVLDPRSADVSSDLRPWPPNRE